MSNKKEAYDPKTAKQSLY